MLQQRTAGRLLTCFILAFLLRACLILAVGGTGTTPDSVEFTEAAREISKGHGFSLIQLTDGKRSLLLTSEPGYSLFLSFWLLIGVPIGTAILWIQAVLGSLLAPVIYSYVERRRDPRTAAAAALIYAVDPIAAGPCLFILRELFTMSVVMATVCAFDIQGKAGTWIKGFLLAAAALSFSLFALWPFYVWMIDRRRGGIPSPADGTSRKVMIGSVLVAYLLIGGWMCRNAILSEGNYVLRRHLTAILPYITASYDFPWLPDPEDPALNKIVTEAVDKFDTPFTVNQRRAELAILKETWRLFQSDPLTVSWRFVKANFWFWTEIPGAMGVFKSKPAIHRILLTAHILQMLFFIAGLFYALRRADSAGLLFAWGTVLYVAVLVFPFMPIPRYYSSILPLIDMVAAYGAICVFEKIKHLNS